MPYKSEAQRAKFHADPKLRKYVPEFDKATGDAPLPKRVRTHKHKKRIRKARHTALGAMLAQTRSVHQ